MAVAGIACGHDAVKHVHTLCHALNQILWCAHPHQVAGLVAWHTRRHVCQYAVHVFFGLAHAQPANGQAVEPQGLQLLQRFIAQRLEHAALHNAKQRVAVAQALHGILATFRPTQTELHAVPGLGLVNRLPLLLALQRQIGCAFVQLHDHV